MQMMTVERKSELAFHHHRIMTHIFCLVFAEYANVRLDAYGPPWSGDSMQNIVHDSFRETMEGSYPAHLFQTVVARRPG